MRNCVNFQSTYGSHSNMYYVIVNKLTNTHTSNTHSHPEIEIFNICTVKGLLVFPMPAKAHRILVLSGCLIGVIISNTRNKTS